MDVSKYIGLFLFKNHFCYIHGLGNLELKKIPASIDNGQINAPQYDVVLTPYGSIDDNFANFIATIEQVSISKASNAIREFSIETKNSVAAGQEILVPTLGKFTEVNGKLGFVTDPHIKYVPPAIPAQQITTRQAVVDSDTDQKKEPLISRNRSSVDWGKIAILAGILIVIILAAVFGIRYLNKQSSDLAPVDTVQATIAPADTVKKVEIPAPADTLATDSSTAAIPATTTAGGMMSYKVIISKYNNLAAAKKRYLFFTKTLSIPVELSTTDSVNFVILMPFTSPASDTTRILDSLKKTYNPSGVSIYK